MKKFWIAVSAPLLIAGLVACGEKTENNTTETNATVETDTSMTATDTAMTSTVPMDTSGSVSTDTAMTSTAPPMTTESFAKDAAEGGMMEVELGKIVAKKASSKDVKDFANMMVTDHTKANDKLKALAKTKNWSLPTELNAEHKSLSDQLKSMSGADLDKAYMKAMVDDHQKDVQKFQDAAASSIDSDLKTFASDTLPTLQKHLSSAQKTASAVGAS